MGDNQEKPDNSTEPEATPSKRLADLLKQIRSDNDKRDREAAEKRRKPPKTQPPSRQWDSQDDCRLS